MRRIFKGFSTIPDGKNVLTRNWTLTDLELVKRDILNQFMTVKGERVMMPTYGSIIWNLLFEQMSNTLVDQMVEDAKKIIKSDSRVEMDNISVRQFENGVILNIRIFYKPWGVYDNFSVEFDKRTKESV